LPNNRQRAAQHAQHKTAKLKDLYFKDRKCYLHNSNGVMGDNANYKCTNVYCTIKHNVIVNIRKDLQ